MTLLVEAATGQVLVQDLGRPDGWRVGVGRSGAFDRTALVAGQRLVGNPPDAAALELTLAELEVVAERSCTVAITGAPTVVRVDDAIVTQGTAIGLAAGHRLYVGRPSHGLRVMVSVAGGVAVRPVLASRSTDTLASIGPNPVRAGDELPVGAPTGRPAWRGVSIADVDDSVLDAASGPHVALLDGATTLTGTVGPSSNRVGVRIGAALATHDLAELASLPVLPGAVQLTPSGELIVLGPDAGLTGGYPVVAVVDRRGLDRLAQRRPGEAVTLRIRPPRVRR